MYARWAIKSQKTPAHFLAAPVTVSNSEFRKVICVYVYIHIYSKIQTLGLFSYDIYTLSPFGLHGLTVHTTHTKCLVNFRSLQSANGSKSQTSPTNRPSRRKCYASGETADPPLLCAHTHHWASKHVLLVLKIRLFVLCLAVREKHQCCDRRIHSVQAFVLFTDSTWWERMSTAWNVQASVSKCRHPSSAIFNSIH
jgi:hypothetical protein